MLTLGIGKAIAVKPTISWTTLAADDSVNRVFALTLTIHFASAKVEHPGYGNWIERQVADAHQDWNLGTSRWNVKFLQSMVSATS